MRPTLPPLGRGSGLLHRTGEMGLAANKLFMLEIFYFAFPFPPLSAAFALPSGGSESGRSTPSLSVLSDSKPPPSTYQQAPRHFHVPGRLRDTPAGLLTPSVWPHPNYQLALIQQVPDNTPGSSTAPQMLRFFKTIRRVFTTPNRCAFEFLPKSHKRQGDTPVLLGMG